MDSYRNLEYRFKSEITEHINNALPKISFKKGFVSMSSDYEDGNLSFDMVLNSKTGISVRIRKNKFIKYKDLTIRYRSKAGGYCEFEKIKNGLADIYFYAYMNQEESELIKIRICDVNAIRKLIKEEKYNIYNNHDGTQLAAFKFSDILKYNGAIYKHH
jgi:hypothetical protein